MINDCVPQDDSYTPQNLLGRKITPSSQETNFGSWHIYYEKSRILPSICSTKFVCEKDNDEFCQFCLYNKELLLPHLPDMVFPSNILSLVHKDGFKLEFIPLEALRCVERPDNIVKVACAEEWQETRPAVEEKLKKFDWTFTTDYKGTIKGEFKIEPTDDKIDFGLLTQKDTILFYNDLTLYEDELHDHGISVLSVKIRVMPSYWYILLRYFLRVDDVLARSNETRYFHQTTSDHILREYTSKEAKVSDLQISPIAMKNPEDVIPLLSIKERKMEKITFQQNKESSSSL